MSPKNILIVAITRMGDLLQSSPTIIDLKKKYPDSKLTILVDKQFATICEGIPGIDVIKQIDMNFLSVGIWNGGESLVSSYEYVSNLVEDLKAYHFDYCLNMSNSTYTALLIKILNIRDTTGWLADEKGYRLMADKWAMLFTSCIYHSNRKYNNINLVDFFRSAAKVTEHPRRLIYNTTQASESKINDFIEKSFSDLNGPLISIQIGASQVKRQWAPRKFALLAKYLVEDLGARIVYTGAPSENGLVDEALSFYQSSNVVSSVGKTSIPELAALLKRSELLVTGDTGPMHLSVAVGKPVVALFLASALCHETGPYSSGNIVIQPQISCNPCNPNYPCARPDCHDQISPELVAYLVKLRISKDSSHNPFFNVPQDIAPPSQVRIYISDFDKEGFLEFHPINGFESSCDPSEQNDIARKTYRQLWKEELAGIEPLKKLDDDINNENDYSSHLSFKSAVLDLIENSENAIKQLKRLEKVAADPTAPASILGEISANLTQIERNLEELSLTFPILGTIIRIFILDKENMRGEDIFILSKCTVNLYEDLIRRLRKFIIYYSSYQSEFLNNGELLK